MTLEERQLLLKKLAADPVACAAGVPELVRFMLGTGQRIGEHLGVLWLEVDLGQRQVEVSSTVIRWNGHGLVRKDTKTRAGRYLSSQVRQFDGQVFCSSGWGWLIQDCSGIFGGTGRRANRSGCVA